MDDIPGKIIDNAIIVPDCYHRLTIKLEKPLENPVSGQFVMLKVPDRDIFLRRPFSIYDVRPGRLTIVYRVVGRGTHALSRAAKGAPVMVLGPLGHGFTIPEKGPCLVIAGGIGYAGVRMLLKRLRGRAILFFGVAGQNELPLLSDLKSIGARIATLDGSHGFHGNVIALFGEHFRSYRTKDPSIFACGPHGMIVSLKEFLETEKAPCQVSVEERMACGMGLCFGCVAETKDVLNPFKRVCKEGPVFNLWDLSL
jgi:dihydroorotate dehydrogenase electron transfer subunit